MRGRKKAVKRPLTARKAAVSRNGRGPAAPSPGDERLAEALAQQAATADILRIIAASRTDSQPVFDAIAESAARLCASYDAAIYRLEADRLVLAAHHGPIVLGRVGEFSLPVQGSVAGHAIRERRAIQVADAQAVGHRYPVTGGHAPRMGVRTMLCVPLLLNGVAVGAFSLRRTEVQRFTTRQIALLRTFADQAVIAIENARLFRESQERNRDLTESLERETATSEILRVISSSPTDLQPVFDMIARSAAVLCGAEVSAVTRFDGELVHLVAVHGSSPRGADALRKVFPRPPSGETVAVRCIRDRAIINVPDVLGDPEFGIKAAARASGFRGTLGVPMLRGGRALGAIVLGRSQVGPFSEREVDLIRTFADQAVIAIENARLFQETSDRNRDLAESLERETATSEILRVISSSPSDLQPVFDIIAKNAALLCGAGVGAVTRFDGELVHLVAVHGSTQRGAAALRRAFPRPPSGETATARAIRDRAVVHISDVLDDPEFAMREAAVVGGFRASLAVPMLRDGRALGAIVVGRRKVGPYSELEIDLLRTFAAQAVIAIENVRLFQELGVRNRDLTDSLEQQTATGEILRVIASSPNDLQPVFDIIARSAALLCGAESSTVTRYDGDLVHMVAIHGSSQRGVDALRAAFPRPPSGETAAVRAIRDRAIAHIPDVLTDAEFGIQGAAVASGFRSVLGVPMLRDGRALGAIAVGRSKVGPFSNREIDLLRTFADQAVIAIENVRLFNTLETKNRDLAESLEQQTATGEILQVISGSPTNVQPVFDAVASSAARLCDAFDSAIFRRDGDRLLLVAHHGPILVGRVGEFSLPLVRGTAAGRTVLDGRTIHVADMQRETAEFPESADNAAHMGFRTILSVPLMREGLAIGTIQLRRTDARPFTERQVTLLQTFANQAVIAIENTRLFTELDARNRDLTETLEQQTATGEILRVISSSPQDVQPVFDTIAHSAKRLCEAEFAFVFRYDGGLVHFVAQHGLSADGLKALRTAWPAPLDGATAAGRAIRDRVIAHIPDIREDPAYGHNQVAAIANFRSVVAIPMLRDGEPIGAITVNRPKAGAFPERLIELLKTFADQAVIAVENVRLFTELDARNRDLTETLDQQTATGEILRAISGSPTDVQPVFDTIARNARRLCSGEFCQVFRVEDGQLHNVANDGQNAEGLAAIRAAFPRPVDEGTSAGRAVLTAAVSQIPDVTAEPAYGTTGVAQTVGFRSIAAVPILRDGAPIGAIAVGRGEVGRFPERQVELLKTFADQAVIAIENVRLFKELEVRNRDLTETLEQQTATGEILRVISSSPTDAQPVFDTIAHSASRLCDARCFVFRFDGEKIHFVAQHGLEPDRVEQVRSAWPRTPTRGTASGRAVLDRAAVHIPDIAQDHGYELGSVAQAAAFRATVAIPILRDGVPIGAISLLRSEPGPFSDRHIELLRTFADQAVIAIENVRLFNELDVRNRDLTETLEQQTATSEILRVISSSPTDIQPVLDAVAANAARLCDAYDAQIYRVEGDRLQLTASLGPIPPNAGAPINRGWVTGRSVVDKRTTHVHDLAAESESEYPIAKETQRRFGHRTTLATPLLREDQALGAILIRRMEVRPFSEKQIKLLETFADQAVIAIENVRLFKELEVRNRDLTQTLEQQTATSEILRVISGSPTDVQPVFDTIVERARRLCEADSASLLTYDGTLVHMGAMSDQTNREQAHALHAAYPMPATRGHASGRAILTGHAVSIPDVREDQEYALADLRDTVGLRTLLSVPMIRSGQPIGAITMQRWGTPRPFSAKQVALLETFAEQAVIAIENTRLFKELEVRNRDLTVTLEQQTATSEILRVISSSPTDVQPVFDTIALSTKRLCDAEFCHIFRFDGKLLHFVGHHGLPSEGVEAIRRAYPLPPGRTSAAARAVLSGQIEQIPDIEADPDYAHVAIARLVTYRSIVAVPLMQEGRAVGAIAAGRSSTGLLPERQLELLKTFADQAVIAIQNVRLFQELDARTQDLTRSVGELKALGEVSQAVSSTLDLEAVLATIVSRAVQLSGSHSGIVYEFDEATETFHARATHEITSEHLEALRAAPIHLGEGAVGTAAAIQKPVQVPDIQDERQLVAHQARAHLIRQGLRSLLAMPLIREGRLFGGLVILRREAGEFAQEVLTTMQTFAAQSVLAIQNARLFVEIQRQKQYSDVLVESSPVAIATMDLQGMVVGWNPAAERLFGYPSAEAVGRSMEVLVATPEIRDDVRGNVERTLAGEWIRDITRRVRKDGSLIDVEISSVPVIVEGARVGMIAIYHDITELLQARREAEAANEAKGAFLATMSHEIRTPMNAVIGMSGLLLNTSLSAEQREYAEIVRQSGDTLLTVINDILDFSKIEAGRLELETQPFDLRECVEGALDLVATRAAEKGLDLAYLLGEGTPGAIVGDVTRLRQVLLNLLSNAVKFTERGEIVLSVTTRRPDDAGGLPELTFSVRDTGIGIPEDRLGRLFQSFSQVDASTTRRYGGTGLGLAISQRLTELMGGHITVTSDVGVGSEFRFTLRAAPAAAPVPTRRDLTGVQPPLRGKRVLVVDDNATNRRILASHLEVWGMLARVSESPLEALAWLGGGERFDLGILDMHMPEMDGVALAHAIRERANGPAMPLILFTSLGRREARADEEGFAAYLHKPIKPSQLFDALISVLGDQPVHVPERGTVRTELDAEMATRHPLRILLAEDNVVNQKVATRLLGQMGYRADIAANGLEAVAAVERQTYDVVLMDVQMPEMDGFEASREINRRWPSNRPRIVAMTANAMEGDRELCVAAGMDDYVAKPIRIEELVGALGRCQTREDAAPRPHAVAAASAPAADVVDRAVIDRLGETMGRDFAVELIDTFVADARDLLAAIQRALAASDRDGFRRAAHTLKSTGESLGAFALAALARELESIGQAGRLHEVGNRVDRLADLYERVAHALGAIKGDLST